MVPSTEEESWRKAGLEKKNLALDIINMRYMQDIPVVMPKRELDVQLCNSHERSKIENYHIYGNQGQGKHEIMCMEWEEPPNVEGMARQRGPYKAFANE